MNLPTFLDVLHARRVIGDFLSPTPLHHYPTLDRLLEARVCVKHENYKPIGVFKVRGGINLLSRLTAVEREQGVITASTGNHGQSISYAAKLFGVRAIIVAPEGANPVKVEAMESHGAEVVFHGKDFDAAKAHCEQMAHEQGLRYISSGDEPDLIAGVGTSILEILEQQPDVEMIFVPIGGGTGAAGACLVAKKINPDIIKCTIKLFWPDHYFAPGIKSNTSFMDIHSFSHSYALPCSNIFLAVLTIAGYALRNR